MFIHALLLPLLARIAFSTPASYDFNASQNLTDDSPTPSKLNVTALTGSNGISVLECWQLSANITSSTTAGTIGAATLNLGAVSNITYTILPAGFDGGIHNAPYVQ